MGKDWVRVVALSGVVSGDQVSLDHRFSSSALQLTGLDWFGDQVGKEEGMRGGGEADPFVDDLKDLPEWQETIARVRDSHRVFEKRLWPMPWDT